MPRRAPVASDDTRCRQFRDAPARACGKLARTPMRFQRLGMIVEMARVGDVEVPPPRYQTEGAAGLDLAAAVAEPVTLLPGARALVPTGWAMAIPPYFEGQV